MANTVAMRDDRRIPARQSPEPRRSRSNMRARIATLEPRGWDPVDKAPWSDTNAYGRISRSARPEAPRTYGFPGSERPVSALGDASQSTVSEVRRPGPQKNVIELSLFVAPGQEGRATNRAQPAAHRELDLRPLGRMPASEALGRATTRARVSSAAVRVQEIEKRTRGPSARPQ